MKFVKGAAKETLYMDIDKDRRRPTLDLTHVGTYKEPNVLSFRLNELDKFIDLLKQGREDLFKACKERDEKENEEYVD